jgi:pSer/pThr/pTyr-binding forkhead associated (FHA) protein/tetratricopeptide (TPR) repeat protein
MQKLVIQDDDGKQTIVPIVREEITIGREEGNTIRLTERNVSRRHARLVRENGSLFFEDTEARYGSKKNGQRVVGRVEFADRDVFIVGDYRLFLYSEAAVATQAAMPAQTHVPAMPPVGTDNTAVIPIQPMAPSAGASPGTPARLVVMNTSLAGLECSLTGDELVVGRTADNGFAIDHRSISRHHARFTKTDSGHRVTDLGSANGTRVNGETYNDIDLRRGDIVELGHVKLRYVGAGESFVFTGAVADDREPSSGVPKMLVLFAILAVLAAVGVIVMVLFGPGGDEVTGQPGVQGGTSAAAPDAVGTADVTPPAPDTGAVAVSPDVGTPPTQVATADSGATIREAERLMRAAQWDEAIELLRTVQVGDPLFGDANTKLDLARSEQSTRENLYNRLVEAESGGRFAEALDLLGQIPQTSYYHELLAAEGVGARIQEAWIASALAQAGQQAEAHRYSEARTTLAGPSERFADDPRFAEALRSIDGAEEAYEAEQAEQAAIAERERLEREEAERLERERQAQIAAAERDAGTAATPPETPRERDAGTAATPPETPRERDTGAGAAAEPEEVDVESLLRDARRLGLRSNHAEAIEVLEQARRADRRNPAIYLMLYSNYIGLGRSGEAADALERYLELRPNDRRADEYRRAIETLRGQ